MKHFTAYAVFVMQAYLAGCEIELLCDDTDRKYWSLCEEPNWTWFNTPGYRIKLPEGWEYVIDDGEIAFREPKKGENFVCADGVVSSCEIANIKVKVPIIKRKEQSK